MPVNAGLPQLVNMTSYLQGWRQNIIDAIPDATWGPVVGAPHDNSISVRVGCVALIMSWREMMVRTGLDWEAWRPTWQENAARPGGEPDQDVDQLESIALVKRQHPDWTDAAQVIPLSLALFTLLRPYLAHLFPVFSRFLRVFTVSTRRF